jgi:DeoR/GlpR family transcriptional regulator of sugar metabolism
MPRSSEHADLRQRELAQWLATRRTVSTIEAARRFGVNPMTIRRDLRALEESGLALRCYGGAMAAQRITFEFAFDERRRHHLAEKERIGRAAAGRVQAGQTVFLDTGTTTLQVAHALAAGSVECRVITSSLAIASALWGRQHIDLILLGGNVRRGSPDLIGPGTEIMLERLSADLAILGTEGLDGHRGGFADDVDTARVGELMAANAAAVVVVADGSKVGRAGQARHLRIEDIDELISGRSADETVLKQLRRQGVRVTLV